MELTRLEAVCDVCANRFEWRGNLEENNPNDPPIDCPQCIEQGKSVSGKLIFKTSEEIAKDIMDKADENTKRAVMSLYGTDDPEILSQIEKELAELAHICKHCRNTGIDPDCTEDALKTATFAKSLLGKTIGSSRCPKCNGHGMIPTAKGRTILAFLKIMKDPISGFGSMFG